MTVSIESSRLKLQVDSLGAQMMSIQNNDGIEYLWQGDKKYWSDRALTLFPFIGRLTNDSYSLNNKVYQMGIHGFAYSSEFSIAESADDRVMFELCSSEETMKQYPFSFRFIVGYELQENIINVCYVVENLGEETMPFGLGGHPGFSVPIEEGKRFEDYYLEFSQQCHPDRVGFTDDVYMNGIDEEYLLEDGRRINLQHNLFDEDAIILKNMAKKITLENSKSSRGVTVSYPQCPYLGIWHWPKTDAPYVCIEPWTSLPSRAGVIEDFMCKSDLIQLPAGESYKMSWTIEVF